MDFSSEVMSVFAVPDEPDKYVAAAHPTEAQNLYYVSPFIDSEKGGVDQAGAEQVAFAAHPSEATIDYSPPVMRTNRIPKRGRLVGRAILQDGELRIELTQAPVSRTLLIRLTPSHSGCGPSEIEE